MAEAKEKVVGIGKLAVGLENERLVSIGLGSCIGLVLYDGVNRIGGMAHIMLPDSSEAHFEKPNLNILLAEHDPGIRKMLREMLEKHEFRIADEAGESIETIRKYNRLTTGAVIMSRYIPEMHGVSTMAMIRQRDSSSKIIFLSPLVDRHTYTELLEQGANEVLMTPFIEEKVVNVTKSVIYTKHIRFADYAVPLLVFKMKNLGSFTMNMEARIAGGANIFKSLATDRISDIGRRNIEAVRGILKRIGIRIAGEDVGGDYGRTVRFNAGSGEVWVSSKKGERRI